VCPYPLQGGRREAWPGRARPTQPQSSAGDGDRAPHDGPPIPPDVDARQLAPEIRRELSTLDRATADAVARHLVAAGELLDEDPEAALRHARAARSRSSRIAAIREAVGIAAYHCGDWAQALAELRAARRMGSKSSLLALIVDCERGLGRPERAIELARGPEAAQLSGDEADELRIVAAGARSDLGQLDQALTVLSTPQLDPSRTGSTAARLFYAYADTLLALGRDDEALQWFLHSAAADIDGVTDAEDRVSELGNGFG
jgi:tetratricopeptide (TPR) repeat protein